MKNIKRKTVIGILVICCMVFSIIAIFTGPVNYPTVASAQEVSENATTTFSNTSPLQVVTAVEEELQEQGTSILEALKNQRNSYLDKLNNVLINEQTVTLAKIKVLDEAIKTFEEIGYCSSNIRSLGIDDNPYASYPFHVSPDCTCNNLNYIAQTPCGYCIEYTDTRMAVNAIAVGFEVRNWPLAADLMFFNLSNTTLDIDYWPSLGYTIAQAPQIANDVAQSNYLTEGFRQDSPGRLNGLFENDIEGDTYNALGSFYYSKTDAGNGNVNISILDRYDWDYINGDSTNVFINTLARAQEIGIVTPFYTRIDLTMPGYVPFNWEYTDTGVALTGVASNNTNPIEFPTEIYDLRIRNTTLPTVNITSLANNSFANQTGITNLTLPSTVTSLGANVFENCINLTTITGLSNVQIIGAGAFKGCSALSNVDISSATISIGNGAFEGCSNLDISVSSGNPNYSAQGNILYNKAKTKIIGSGDIAENITIPNTVTEVEDSAFRDNSNLKRVDIYGTPKIGEFSFSDCENLDEVYFYSYVVPEVEAGAFANNAFTVYVPYNKQSIYYTRFSGYTNSIDSIPITVTLKKDGTVYQTLNTYYGADISGLSEPYKEGHTFNYWEDEAGTIYQNGGIWNSTVDLSVEAIWTARQFYITFTGEGSENLESKLVTYDQAIGALPQLTRTGYTFNGWKDENSVYYTADTIWQRTSNLLLTSDFSPNQYIITYNENGGTSSDSTQAVEYGEVVNSLATASKTGYTFLGWNTEVDGSGETISAPYVYEIADNITLYAQYMENTYEVTFDKQGGIGGTNGVDVIYNEAMPTATAPTKTGYTFGGYYAQANGAGTQYYDENMTSQHVWNHDSPATLYAKWIANTYEVKLQVRYPGGENKTYTSNSSSDIQYINYTATENTTITIWTTHTSGDPYLLLYNEQLSLITYNDDGNGNSDSKITYTVSSGVKYVIGFRAYGSTTTTGNVYISKNITATYGSVMPVSTIPTQTGYTFGGYYTGQNGSGTKYYDADMNSVNNWSIAGTTTLYAKWTANTYTVILNKQSSELSGTDSVSVTYGEPMPEATAPSKKNYVFQGYFAEPEGGGTQYYDSDMNSVTNWDIAEGGTIYAYWIGESYSITFNKQGGSGGTTSITVHYGSEMPTATAPTRKNYVLVGYFDQPKGMGAKYYDGPNMISVKEWDKESNTTLYAYWRGEYFDIIYDNLTFKGKKAQVLLDNTSGNYAPTFYEYGVGLDLTRISAYYYVISPYEPHLQFLGWYEDHSFTKPISIISQTKNTSIRIYAKWRYDYDNPSRYGTYTITDSGRFNQSYDQIFTGLTNGDLYNDLDNLGIKYLSITLKINMWEVDDGYQYIFLYDGPNESSNLIWSVEIEHGGSGKSSTPRVYEFEIFVPIESIRNCQYLYIRYGASGMFSDTWQNDIIYYEMMYVVEKTDIYPPAPEFIWSYQDPFN